MPRAVVSKQKLSSLIALVLSRVTDGACHGKEQMPSVPLGHENNHICIISSEGLCWSGLAPSFTLRQQSAINNNTDDGDINSSNHYSPRVVQAFASHRT